MSWSNSKIAELKTILKSKKIKISNAEIRTILTRIEDSQQLFPLAEQRAVLIRLLHNYEHSQKNVVIFFEEVGGTKLPATFMLAALAEDWSGMSNSILGIIHQKVGNVLFLRGLTLPFEQTSVGIVLLAFVLANAEDYNRFRLERSNLTSLIRQAALGSRSKTLLLADETIKFEIYNDVVKRIQKTYKEEDIQNLTGENGEALKFFSSRSREYLEERKPANLAEFIIDNYRFQQALRVGQATRKIKIKNFETLDERLTGITFACWEGSFSVENFLKTLEFIVPGHIIKYHKSFVTREGILVYRIEIVDSEENPLNPAVIKSLEHSLAKQIRIATDEEFSQVKAIGGFEHYARAIIPFLMEELQRTGMRQVFIHVEKKTEFLLHTKLFIVTFQPRQEWLNLLIRKLENHRGLDIYSSVPPRTYKSGVEVSIINLQIRLAEFPSIAAIFDNLKGIIRKVYGEIRDFDEGLREKEPADSERIARPVENRQPLADQRNLFQYRRAVPPGDAGADHCRHHQALLRNGQGGRQRSGADRGQPEEHPFFGPAVSGQHRFHYIL